MVEHLSQKMRSAWKGRLPKSIIRIPKNLTMDSFRQILSASPAVAPGYLELGLLKSNGQAAAIDLDKHHAMFITGPSRSGRTNMVAAMGEMLRSKGARVHYFGTALLLKEHADQYPDRVTLHPIDTASIIQFMETELNPEMAHRKTQQLIIPTKDAAAQKAFTQSLEPFAVFIDDVDAFIDALATKADYLKWWSAACTMIVGRRLYLIFTASHKGFNRKRMSDLFNVLVSIPYGVALCGMLSDCNPWNIADLSARKLKLPLGEALLVQDQQIDHIVIPRVE